MDNKQVGVLGATSFVGECLLPLLTGNGWQVTAFSRRVVGQSGDGVTWRQLPLAEHPSPQPYPLPSGETTRQPTKQVNLQISANPKRGEEITPHWICVAPIWVLPDYFSILEAHGVRRIVALSSTSRFTKDDSSDLEEQAIARRLAKAEERVQDWAESKGIEWVVLRPTLIYGRGRDKNISEIAHFIRRFGFFPLLGQANGLRQPVHADDVAGACFAALNAPRATNLAYNISGSETLAYRDMVVRIFTALGRRPRLLTVPLWVFSLAVTMLRCLPRYRQWSTAMAERMNQELVFDHADATRDFGFRPRRFSLNADNLPSR